MSTVHRGNYKSALATLRQNKGRSVLTMVGIIIGVSSVIAIVSIGEGVKEQVTNQINQLGHNLITIRPGTLIQSNVTNLNQYAGLRVGGSLSSGDQQIVSHTKGVKIAVPLTLAASSVSVGKQTFSLPVIGTNATVTSVLAHTTQYGGFFDDSDSQNNKIVIGANLAERLFGESVPLGATVTIDNQSFIVTGIMNSFDSAPLSDDIDFNNVIFMPYAAAQSLASRPAPIYEILVLPQSAHQVDQTVQAITNNLAQSHGGQHDFSVLTQSQSVATSTSILNLLTELISGVAIISLIVGGIGIMNITLVSVTERMHEIGIRKAIGATNHQILNQFVMEAAVLSITGGIIGIIVAYAFEIIMRIVSTIQPVITWQIVIIAFAAALFIGIAFGSVPALKAARKDPIDALRNE
jgi:putative ABC transport system permease protein